MTNDFTGTVLDAAIPRTEVGDAEFFRERTQIFGAEAKRYAAPQFVGIDRGLWSLGVGHEGDGRVNGRRDQDG